MKIFFDSNIWRIITTPQKFKKEKSISDFLIIRQGIIERKIEAFISKTTFTLEAIKRIDRKEILGSRRLKITTNKNIEKGNYINTSFTITSEASLNFSNNPILKTHYEDALSLGFKVIGLPRLGMLNNDDIESMTYKFKDEEFSIYMEKASKIVEKIEAAGAGKSQLDYIGQKYHSLTFEGLKLAPESEISNISNATAEWADGDSVASSIAIGCSYFCTRDVAKKAGTDSVLSAKNLDWLLNDYGFKTINPEKLASIL